MPRGPPLGRSAGDELTLTQRVRNHGAIQCNLCGARVTSTAPVYLKDGHEILRCPACGLLFRGDLPALDALPRIYGEAYFRAPGDDLGGQGYADYLADEREHRHNARKRVRLLNRYMPVGELLDVGCAAGFFLDEARRVGWAVAGVDISAQMAAWARHRLRLPVVTGRFLDVDLGDAAFDALTMWDYIEHVIDPRAEFSHAADLLRPSGILALSTGDSSSAVARMSGKRWHLLTPRHHNFFFTQDQLSRYLENQGFEILATKYVWSSYSLTYLAHKSQAVVSVTPTPLRRLIKAVGQSPLGMVRIPMNLYDIVTIIARKV
jgi:2-polyprenyl-3-methyl-5-hydroxy-6-metoxy-1,4-benzoquinol methylase